MAMKFVNGDPSRVYDEGRAANGGYYETRSKSAYASGGPGMFDVGAPSIQYRVFIGPDGNEWASQDEYQRSSGGGQGGYGGAQAQLPQQTMQSAIATYVAPRAVDKTNIYEDRLKALVNNPNSISDTNAYKFRFNQGQQAIERSAAAKGMTGSGNLLAELANYGQGMASQEYGSEYDRLAGMTGQQKNYILGLIGAANQEAATANQFQIGNQGNVNQFNLGSQKNMIDWNLGTERNSIARMAAENEALNGARRFSGSSTPAPTFNPGGFGGSTPQWQQDASRDFFNRDDRAIAYAY
jgi:hypothetical protein